jgi:hypothetical protein
MRTALLFVCVVGLTACGVSEAQLDETSNEVTTDEGELGSSSRTYVVARRDFRRCAAPMCGGFWIHDINRATVREVYVPGFDFSRSNLINDEDRADVTNAPEFEVVLFGKLGALKNGYRDFVVTSAWRGMPGMQFKEGADTFYSVADANVQCVTAPCPTMKATKLHSTSATLFHDISVERAAKPLVDQNWLTARVTDKGALVAGRFVNASQFGAGVERILDAAQVFVKLPDMTQSCPRPSLPLCPGSKQNVWVRDTNLCTMPAGCAAPGACAAFVPSCEDGYSLQSWTGGVFACTQYACDPAFLHD